jgi:hypothetical protein
MRGHAAQDTAGMLMETTGEFDVFHDGVYRQKIGGCHGDTSSFTMSKHGWLVVWKHGILFSPQ